MAAWSYIVCLGALFSGLLLTVTAGCDVFGALGCLKSFTSYAAFDFNSESSERQRQFCSDYREGLQCLKSKTSDCASGAVGDTIQSPLNSAQKALDEHCGAGQLLMSWMLFAMVLALTLKQLYSRV